MFGIVMNSMSNFALPSNTTSTLRSHIQWDGCVLVFSNFTHSAVNLPETHLAFEII